jgi:predicted HTH domain antitoxin
MSIVLEIPEDILGAMRLPPDSLEAELRKELALTLYHRRILPFGKARLLAQVSLFEFEEFLRVRRIPRDYSETTLEEDIRYARGGM